MYTTLIAFALLAILVSFLCSMWEAVLLSITPSYAQAKLNEGTKTGKRLQYFKSNIDKPLAAILTLNTIAHTVGAIGVGEQAGRIWLDTAPFITSFLVPVGMTVAVLILSEIIPKTLGAANWKMLAPFTTHSLHYLILGLLPLVWVCQFITRRLNSDKEKSVFSRHDFLAMAQIGENEGALEETESQFIHNLLRFNKITVREIMTPRTVVQTASETMTVQEYYEDRKPLRFSRIPLTENGEKDHVTGYVLKDKILEHLVDKQDSIPLSNLKRDMIVVPEKSHVYDLFNKLIETREHIALIVDEFGGMAGVVSMEDIIETLLGMEIVDEMDGSEDMQELARQRWSKRQKA